MFSQSSISEALSKFFRFDSLAENLSGYVEARVELLKLEVREDVAKVPERAGVVRAVQERRACRRLLVVQPVAIHRRHAPRDVADGVHLVARGHSPSLPAGNRRRSADRAPVTGRK